MLFWLSEKFILLSVNNLCSVFLLPSLFSKTKELEMNWYINDLRDISTQHLNKNKGSWKMVRVLGAESCYTRDIVFKKAIYLKLIPPLRLKA